MAVAPLGILLAILSFACGITTLVCWVIIMIDAFQNEIWKGLLFFVCGLYSIYYALFEFDHEKKFPIIFGFFSSLFLVVLLQIIVRTMAVR